jgi:isoleucyl-tRNA synthetase
MQHIIEAMVRWLAPILSFTAEEIWRHMPGQRPESVFFSTWAELPAGEVAATTVDWNAVLATRTAVLRELERLRVAGEIGAPLDADVNLYAVPAVRASLAPLGDELRFVLITSGAQVHAAEGRPEQAVPADPAAATGLWIHVRPTAEAKCIRCWHKRADVGSDPAHPELCARCVVNLDGAGETRRFA